MGMSGSARTAGGTRGKLGRARWCRTWRWIRRRSLLVGRSLRRGACTLLAVYTTVCTSVARRGTILADAKVFIALLAALLAGQATASRPDLAWLSGTWCRRGTRTSCFVCMRHGVVELRCAESDRDLRIVRALRGLRSTRRGFHRRWRTGSKSGDANGEAAHV